MEHCITTDDECEMRRADSCDLNCRLLFASAITVVREGGVRVDAPMCVRTSVPLRVLLRWWLACIASSRIGWTRSICLNAVLIAKASTSWSFSDVPSWVPRMLRAQNQRAAATHISLLE